MEALKEGSADRAEESGAEESSGANFWHEAMDALATVFSSYLAASETAVLDASRNSKAIDALFNLLWDTATRTFAFSHILLLMKVSRLYPLSLDSACPQVLSQRGSTVFKAVFYMHLNDVIFRRRS